MDKVVDTVYQQHRAKKNMPRLSDVKNEIQNKDTYYYFSNQNILDDSFDNKEYSKQINQRRYFPKTNKISSFIIKDKKRRNIPQQPIINEKYHISNPFKQNPSYSEQYVEHYPTQNIFAEKKEKFPKVVPTEEEKTVTPQKNSHLVSEQVRYHDKKDIDIPIDNLKQYDFEEEKQLKDNLNIQKKNVEFRDANDYNKSNENEKYRNTLRKSYQSITHEELNFLSEQQKVERIEDLEDRLKLRIIKQLFVSKLFNEENSLSSHFRRYKNNVLDKIREEQEFRLKYRRIRDLLRKRVNQEHDILRKNYTKFYYNGIFRYMTMSKKEKDLFDARIILKRIVLNKEKDIFFNKRKFFYKFYYAGIYKQIQTHYNQPSPQPQPTQPKPEQPTVNKEEQPTVKKEEQPTVQKEEQPKKKEENDPYKFLEGEEEKPKKKEEIDDLYKFLEGEEEKPKPTKEEKSNTDTTFEIENTIADSAEENKQKKTRTNRIKKKLKKEEEEKPKEKEEIDDVYKFLGGEEEKPKPIKKEEKPNTGDNMTFVVENTIADSEEENKQKKTRANRIKKMLKKKAKINYEELRKYFYRFYNNGLLLEIKRISSGISMNKRNSQDVTYQKRTESFIEKQREIIKAKEDEMSFEELKARVKELLENIIYKKHRMELAIMRNRFSQLDLKTKIAKIESLVPDKKKVKKKKKKKKAKNDEPADTKEINNPTVVPEEGKMVLRSKAKRPNKQIPKIEEDLDDEEEEVLDFETEVKKRIKVNNFVKKKFADLLRPYFEKFKKNAQQVDLRQTLLQKQDEINQLRALLESLGKQTTKGLRENVEWENPSGFGINMKGARYTLNDDTELEIVKDERSLRNILWKNSPVEKDRKKYFFRKYWRNSINMAFEYYDENSQWKEDFS